MVLGAGDIIYTGTPEGVGPVNTWRSLGTVYGAKRYSEQLPLTIKQKGQSLKVIIDLRELPFLLYIGQVL